MVTAAKLKGTKKPFRNPKRRGANTRKNGGKIGATNGSQGLAVSLRHVMFERSALQQQLIELKHDTKLPDVFSSQNPGNVNFLLSTFFEKNSGRPFR